MSRIRIKNFGPIKEGFLENDGWMDVEKVTVFIGNQGSGKSTVAKTISTLMWLEKAFNRGDYNLHTTHTLTLFFQEIFKYQRIKEYFKKDTIIEYSGDVFSVEYQVGEPIYYTVNSNRNYEVPKIMYIPAERNFLSTIEDVYNVTGLPDALFDFAEEFRKAQEEQKDKKVQLPLSDYQYLYNKEYDRSYVVGKDHNVDLLEASSGFQSLIPLFLVSQNLSSKSLSPKSLINGLSVDQKRKMDAEKEVVLANLSLSQIEKDDKIEAIEAKYKSRVFINIVEEPEQNLYPVSQWELLKKLLEFNAPKGNKLIMTTHSPYLVNYLSIAIQADYLNTKISGNKNEAELIEKMEKIIPQKSLVAAKDVVVYELDEKTGTIKKLPNPEGIPSDKNNLNQSLRDCNEMFDSLLEIEQEL